MQGSSLNSVGIIYDKSHCKIYFNEEINAVYLQWFGYSNNRQFIEACEFAFEMMATHHVGRALSDNRKAGVLSQENQKWLLEEWFPRASKRGFLKYAVICSEDELHNMGLESLLQQVEHSEFLIRYCESERAAIDWLKVH